MPHPTMVKPIASIVPFWPPWLNPALSLVDSQWTSGTLHRGLLYEKTDCVEREEDFLHHAQALAKAVLGFLDTSADAKRVVRDTPMYLLLVASVALHQRASDVGDRSGDVETDRTAGVTLTHLCELLGLPRMPTTTPTTPQSGAFAGQTQVQDMLRWARARGLLVRAAARGQSRDRRVQRFEPSPTLVMMFQRWIAAFMATNLFPWPTPREADGLPPAWLVKEVLALWIDAFRHEAFVPTERHPAIQQVMMRRHGYHMFLRLVADLEIRPAPAAISGVAVNVSSIASQFDVSRGTVRNVLSLANELGWVDATTAESRKARFKVTEQFLTTTRQWMTLELTSMNGLVWGAFHRCEQSRSCANARVC
ncbi:MAG: hypothetical protein ACKO1L_06315 [Brachymonas sp.]